MMALTMPEPRAASADALCALVVDPDPTTAGAVRAACPRAFVTAVGDAYQAVQLVMDGRVDVVVTAAFLPGESGLDLVARLRASPLTRNVGIVLVAHGAETARRAFERGADRVVRAPVRPDTLHDALSAFGS